MKPFKKMCIPYWISLAINCGVLLCTSMVYGDQQPGTSADMLAEQSAAKQSAPVVVDGAVLFHVAGVPAYPAKKRAKEIAQRIRDFARDPAFDPSTLQIREVNGLIHIYAGNKRLLIVLPEDAQASGMLPSKTQMVARELFLKKITEAIGNYRRERTPEILLKNGINALVRTVILVLLLFIVTWLFRKLRLLVERRFKRKIEKLEAKSLRIVRWQQIWSILQGGLRIVHALIVLALIFVFLNFVLSLFPWTRRVAHTLLGYVIEPLLSMARASLDYLPNLFFLIVLFFFVRYLVRIMRAFFYVIHRGQLKLARFDPEWALPTFRIVRVIVIILAIVIAYPYLPGSGSEAFKGISLLVGILFSLGSTSLISNVVAGYTMTYRRAFKVGDRVKIGDHIGEVTEIHLLVTHLRSLKNEEVVIPNSIILGGEIVNFSSMVSERGLILHTEVGIGYEVPWRQVEAMLLMAAERTPDLLQEPKPFVLQTALGDFAVTYELNVFSKEAEKMAMLYTELHRNIQDVFNEYNIQIMTPHYEGDPEEPKLVQKEHWHTAPALPPQTGS